MQATGSFPPIPAGDSGSAQVSAQLKLLTTLRPTFTEFIRQYGALPGEEFQATATQALFFSNGNTIDSWLKPDGENLIARLSKLDNADTLIDNLYWSIHSRPPTESERRAAHDYLKDGSSEKPAALSELAWALLSSTEFRFNH
jgi:hypothetical protein